MERKYTCKAKLIDSDAWVVGHYIENNGRSYIATEGSIMLGRVRPETVCRYLLDDMNGNPAYENDTISTTCFGCKQTEVIVFENGVTSTRDALCPIDLIRFQVTGNIHNKILTSQ